MFGRHHAIERFGVIFLTLVILMGTLTTTIVVRKNAADAQQLSNRAIYTTKVVMSRSQVTGSVVSVMTSEDKTKAFLLLKMDDMTRISANAEDYIMFLTGSDATLGRTALISRPSGGIYMFGTTGYMGVYLVNNEPFPSQVLNLVIRGVKDLSSVSTAQEAHAVGGDESFEKFDQMRIGFNPGAFGATHAAFLDAPKINMLDMYREAIVKPAEADYKKVLQSDLQYMFEQQRLANQYIDRLVQGTDGTKLAAPTVPSAIANDTISAMSYDGVPLNWSNNRNGWVDSSGNLSSNYYLNLKTDYVYPGGYDFNWQTISATEGWLDDLRGNMTVDAYLQNQRDAKAAADSNREKSLNLDSMGWFYTDGTIFRLDNNSSDEKAKSITQHIELLKQAWSSYFETKVKYQTQDLQNLLYLERESKTVTETYSDNFADDVLTLY